MSSRVKQELIRRAPVAGWAVLLVCLALVLTRIPLALLVPALGGAAVALLILLRPLWGLFLLGASIPFATVGEQAALGTTLGAVEVLLAWTLASWLVIRLASGRVTLPTPWHTSTHIPSAPLYLPLALVIGTAGLSLLQATSLRDAIPELVKWIEVLALYLIAVDLLWSPSATSHDDPTQPARWLVAAILFGASLQAVLGLYQFIYQVGPPAFQILGRFLRAYGTFRQPNPFAGYLGLVLPLALSVFYWALGQWWQRLRFSRRPTAFAVSRPGAVIETKPGDAPTQALAGPGASSYPQDSFDARTLWLYLIGSGMATGLIAAGIIASWSRGAWLGVLASVLVVTTLRSRRTFWLSLAVAGLLALVLVARGGLSTGVVGARLADVQQYLGGFDVRTIEVNDDNFAVVERVAHWDAARQMIERAPWLGIGAGNYAVVYPQVALPRWQDPLGHAHNIYLHTWAETGLVGLLSYLLLWLVALWQAWRVAHDPRITSWQRAAVLGVLGIIVHLSVHNLVDNLLVQRMYLHLALVLALLTVPVTHAIDEWHSNKRIGPSL